MPFIWGISLVAAMGGLLFGYDFVVIGGAKPFYEKFFLITSENLSGWANSCALIGCLIGAIVSGGLSDRYGRKRLLLLSGFLFTTSSIGTGAADVFSTFVIWRILGGVAIGLASNLSPMYIAEVAPAGIRGKLVAVNQLTIVIGAVLSQVVNWQVAEIVPHRSASSVGVAGKIEVLKSIAQDFATKGAAPEAREMIAADIEDFETRSRDLQRRYPRLDLSDRGAVAESERDADFKNAVNELNDLSKQAEWWEIYASWNGKTGWRWMFGLTAVPSLVFFLLMFFVPESPRWLAKNGKSAMAQGILGRIGGAAYAERAIGEIEATLVDEVEKVDFRELLEPKMRKVLLLGVALAIFQQWCGVNTLINYADTVFTSAGYGISELMFNIVVTGAVNLLFTFIAIFTIDRFGRRILMLLGAAGLSLIYFAIGVCFHYHSHGFHLFALIVSVMACFAFSLGPTVWVVISEIYPNRIRGAAVSVSVFALWFGCFTLVYAFPQLIKFLSVAGTFWIYSAVCLAGFLFIWRKLPETKGKTLEEIEKELVD
ncbi:MAG: MFS transporter [Pirellulales bacterium]|nr:MFS transporter [Pirellulales bacterium]